MYFTILLLTGGAVLSRVRKLNRTFKFSVCKVTKYVNKL